MAIILHKFHRNITAVVGPYEVAFDGNGKGEIDNDRYVSTLLMDFPGLFSMPEADEPINSGGNKMGDGRGKSGKKGR